MLGYICFELNSMFYQTNRSILLYCIETNKTDGLGQRTLVSPCWLHLLGF